MKIQTIELLLPPMKMVSLSKKDYCDLRTLCAAMSDEEIAGYAKQDDEYFGCLVERYEWKMKIYVKRIAGASRESVDDIVQEVFIKVYANIQKFDQTMKFSSWIYRIAHNQAVNKFLYEKKRKTESMKYSEKGELMTVIKDRHNIWTEIQQDCVNEKLRIALLQVPEKYKDVIELNYFQEKSYKEMALKLNRPVNTIGTMLNRGKGILKKELIQMGVFCDIALVQMEKI